MSPLFKNRIKKILSALGVNLTQNQRYDAQSLRIMRKVLNKNSVCIDVGAHKGEVLDEMIALAPDAVHLAFEPIPSFFQDLIHRYEGKAKVFNVALSDKVGTTTFQHVVSNPAYSGMKQRAYQQEETIEEIQVEMARLDDLLDPEMKIDLMKIDVEGAELQVLKGAEKMLMKWKPTLIFEHGKGASEFYGTSPQLLFEFLDHCGMKVSLMKSYLEGKAPMSLDEFVGQYEREENYYFVAHS